MFDLKRLTEKAVEVIAAFAKDHQDETFYAFAIDDGMLCLNSIESFTKSLEEYRRQFPGDYDDPHEIAELRMNTGDWEYQGFYSLKRKDGFDIALSQEHYEAAMESEDGHADDSEYAKAMNQLLQNLIDADGFAPLRRTADFTAFRVDHDY